MHKVFLNQNISYKISYFMFSLKSQTAPGLCLPRLTLSQGGVETISFGC